MAKYQMIPIGKLRESKMNTRKHQNLDALVELTESVRTHGILTPIIVRPVKGYFEIAAGSRRFIAAKGAGLKEVPAIVRKMSDIEFLEVVNIENLQREDIHEMDEAEGYAVMISKGGHTVATLAATLKKSKSYIHKRLKLCDLIEEGRKLFFDEKINMSLALQIARLQPKDQIECLKECLGYGGLMSKRELIDHIDRTYHLTLKDAPFSTKKSVGGTLPCVDCTKRTGSAPELFEGEGFDKGDNCTDPACWDAKVACFLGEKLWKAAKKAGTAPILLSDSYYEGPRKLRYEAILQQKWKQVEGDSPCESAGVGVIVHGDKLGRSLQVCADTKCKVHHGHYYHDPGSSSESEKKAEREHKIEVRARMILFERVLDKTPDPDPLDMIKGFIDCSWHETLILLAKMFCAEDEKKTGIPGKALLIYAKANPDQHSRLLLSLALARTAANSYSALDKTNLLAKLAKDAKIDIKKVRKEAREELKPKKKTKKKAKKKGEKK